MVNEQARADRATLALSFAIIAMLFSAGTMFFYYELSKLKAEEVRQTVDSREALKNQMHSQTTAAKEQTEAIKEFTIAVRQLAKAVGK